MKQSDGKRTARGIVIGIFVLILFLPAILLPALSLVTGETYDTTLYGYTEQDEEPELTAENWFSGSFQKAWSSRLEKNMQLRAYMVKTRNTLDFALFRKGNDVIGKNDDLFEMDYISAELTLRYAEDYSLEEHVRDMEKYADKLRKLKNRLKKHGKTLIYMVTPSKASLNRENIPDRYIAMDRKHERGIDVFRREIEKTNVPCLFCADMAGELEYPAFYITGIHWSRTYEQLCTRKLISLIRETTGRDYQNIALGPARESKMPFYRDRDLWDLANVFIEPDVTYYEYEVTTEPDPDAPNLRILLQGDSFAEGQRLDILTSFPDAEVYTIIRNEYIIMPDGERISISHNLSRVDWQYFLDNTDIVVVESNESLVRKTSFGFVSKLYNVMKDYQPSGDGEL